MESNTDKSQIGIVGLGLMGCSIVTALLTSKYPVIAIAPIPSDLQQAPGHIQSQLHHCKDLGLLHASVDTYYNSLRLSEDYRDLRKCRIVIECVTEEEEIKSTVYTRIEENVLDNAIIGTNTSAIPISQLQKQLKNPKRFLGIHWSEPAYATRFLEITCGEQTEMDYANQVFQLAHDWNKEPTLLRKDIRGFITNRLMYAVYREGLALNKKGTASLEDLDKSFRYDAGSWITLMGIFRRMDYIGIDKYVKTLENILPLLSNSHEVPQIMKNIVKNNAKGIHNLKGLYSYTNEEARQWEKAFSQFNKDIYQLMNTFSYNSDRDKDKLQ